MISVSGIRGIVGESLTPENLTSFTMAFATWTDLQKKKRDTGSMTGKPKIVIGRDTRPSGGVIADLCASTLLLCGCDVVDLGVATTPTVEIATIEEKADGGLIVTASHNPVEWNALKMLNEHGEFLTAEDVEILLDIARNEKFVTARWNGIGTITGNNSYDAVHIGSILKMNDINRELIAGMNYRVLVDCVQGAGSFVVPELCRRLGITQLKTLSCEGTGIFPRNPEPIEEHLAGTIEILKQESCDFGLVVDPDVDRLALICEDGTLFGEEYTLVACADFYLKNHRGPVANNLSSSRALYDIAGRHGQECFSAKVGEANVIEVMKKTNAVIGGEGNGGVILPELHYGRDALVGIALFIQAFTDWKIATGGTLLSEFRQTFPNYFMSKQKLHLEAPAMKALGSIFDEIALRHPEARANRLDGLKLDFPEGWVHLRPSNTEPIVRIYAEAGTKEKADGIADSFMHEIMTVSETACH